MRLFLLARDYTQSFLNYKRSEDWMLRIAWGKPSVLISHCGNNTIVLNLISSKCCCAWNSQWRVSSNKNKSKPSILLLWCPKGSLHGTKHQHDCSIQASQLRLGFSSAKRLLMSVTLFGSSIVKDSQIRILGLFNECFYNMNSGTVGKKMSDKPTFTLRLTQFLVI